MFNRIIAVILSLSLLINPCMAQESSTDDNFDISGGMVWQPERQTLSFGSLELEVWIMPAGGMITPSPGYLMPRGGVGQLLERMNNFQARIDDVVAEERASCDTQLEECRESCKRQNAELRTNFDLKVKEVSDLNLKIEEIDSSRFYWQIGAVGATVIALSLGIFAATK